jgi:hypothetical protein
MTEEEGLAHLLSLVEHLRAVVTELHGQWEALGEELEAKRGQLRLVEATVEIIQQRRGEGAVPGERVEPAGGGLSRALGDEHVSQAAQARSPGTEASCGTCEMYSLISATNSP